MNDFVSIRELNAKDLRALIDLGIHIKSSPDAYAYSLKGLSMAMIFEKPSLRTRVTFDIGIHQLGGHALYLSPAEISMGKRETIHDVAKNLERMVDLIMIRTFSHATIEELALHASIPVINGLSDYSHPCQAVADFMTILELKGKIAGVKLAYFGDGNNVARSLMFAGALLGAEVFICTPRGYEPDAETIEWSQAAAKTSGGKCVVTNDPLVAIERADIVYTDVWASMGQEAEAEDRAKIFRPYQVSQELFRKADGDATFLHCLPAHRGEEVSEQVIDSPRSRVFQQAENRLHAQKAILYTLLHDRHARRSRTHVEEFAAV
jgi:ornithine carbamoyltransferase